jgi:(p)ppGpp synthase/HD superfamily hydrolase
MTAASPCGEVPDECILPGCCAPICGDPTLGYICPGEPNAVVLHLEQCPLWNVAEAPVPTHRTTTLVNRSNQALHANVEVLAVTGSKLITDLSDVLAACSADLVECHLEAGGRTSSLMLTLGIRSRESLRQALSALRAMPGVLFADRFPVALPEEDDEPLP